MINGTAYKFVYQKRRKARMGDLTGWSIYQTGDYNI